MDRKQTIELVIAFVVLIVIVFNAVELVEDNELKKQIVENCGYETKDYVCYCEKKFIDAKREEIRLYEEESLTGEINIDKLQLTP